MAQFTLQAEAVQLFDSRAAGEISFRRRKADAAEIHFLGVHAERGFPAHIADLQAALPERERTHAQVAGEQVMAEVPERGAAANQYHSLWPLAKSQGAQ